MGEQCDGGDIQTCPWCASGDTLKLCSDGCGNVMVACSSCGCKGPSAPVTGDFEEADNIAIDRWSSRIPGQATVASSSLDRMSLSLALHRLMNESMDDQATIAVPYADLVHLMEAVIAKPDQVRPVRAQAR